MLQIKALQKSFLSQLAVILKLKLYQAMCDFLLNNVKFLLYARTPGLKLFNAH